MAGRYGYYRLYTMAPTAPNHCSLAPSWLRHVVDPIFDSGPNNVSITIIIVVCDPQTPPIANILNLAGAELAGLGGLGESFGSMGSGMKIFIIGGTSGF